MSKLSFELGQCVMTRGIQDLIELYNFNPLEYIARHHACDFSELCKEDQSANYDAIADGSRIFSKFTFRPDAETSFDLYVITEAKDDHNLRNSTCVLLANEY